MGFLAERTASHYDLRLVDLSPNEDLLCQIESDQSFARISRIPHKASAGRRSDMA